MLWCCLRTTLLLLLLFAAALSSVGTRDRDDGQVQNERPAPIRKKAPPRHGSHRYHHGRATAAADASREADAAAATADKTLAATTQMRDETSTSMQQVTRTGLFKDLNEVSKGAGGGRGRGGSDIDNGSGRAHHSSGGGGGERGCLRGHGRRPASCRTSRRPSGRSLPKGVAAVRRQPHHANAVANSLVKSADAKVAATRRRTLQTSAVGQHQGMVAAAPRKNGGGGGSGGGGKDEYLHGYYGTAADDIIAAAKFGTAAATAAASDVSSGIYANAKKPLAGSTASSGSKLPYRSYITDKLGDDVPIRTRAVDPEIYPIYMDGDTGRIAGVLQSDDGSPLLFSESSADESHTQGRSGVNVGGDSSKGPRQQQQQQQDPLKKETEMRYILYDVLGDKSVFDQGPDSVAATRHDGHLPGPSDTFPYDISEPFLQQMYDYTSDGTTTTGVSLRGFARGSVTAAVKVDKASENDEEKAAALELWQALYDMFSDDDAKFGPQQEAMYIRLYEQDPVLFWAVHDEVVARRVGDKDEVEPGWSDPAANPGAANPSPATTAAATTSAVVAVAYGDGMVIDVDTGSTAATADKVVLGGDTSGPGLDSAAYDYPSHYGDDVYESEYDQMLWGKEHGNHLLQDTEVRQRLNENEQQQQHAEQQDVMRKVMEASTAVAATFATSATSATSVTSAGPAATSTAADRTEKTVVAVIPAGGESSIAATAATTAVGAFASRDVSSDSAARGDDGASISPTPPTTTTTTTVTSVTAHGSEQAVAAAASHLPFLQAMSRWSVRHMQHGGAVSHLSTVPEFLSGAVNESAAITGEDALLTTAPGARTAARDAEWGLLERAGTTILLVAVAVTITALLIALVAVAALTYHRGRLAYGRAASPNQRNSAAAPTVMIRFVGVRGARRARRNWYSHIESLSSLSSGSGSGGDNGDGAPWHRDSGNKIAAAAYRDKGLTAWADNRRVHDNVEEGWAEQHQCNGSGSGGGGDGGGTAASGTPSLELLIPPLQNQQGRASGGGLPLHDSSGSWISQILIDRLQYL